MAFTDNTVIDAILIIGLCVALSLAILWVVRRVFPAEDLMAHNEIFGFVYAVLGVIYGIVLGLSVVGVWDGYRSAEDNANAEANALGNIYRIAEGLPEPARGTIQGAALAYASGVVDEEWPAMQREDSSGSGTLPLLDTLWSAYNQIEVSSRSDQELYAAGLTQLEDLSDYRRDRLVESSRGLLGIMWAVVIGGALITIVFPCLFGAQNGLIHGIVISSLALTLGLLLYLINDVNRPFQGGVHVEPEAMRRVLEQFGGG